MRSPAPQDDAEYLAQYAHRSHQIVLDLRAARAAIQQVEGRAESEDGLIQASADSQAAPAGLRIDPRALRLGEAALGTQVTEVLRAAQEHAVRQAQEIADELEERTTALREPLDETFVRQRVEQAARDLL